MRSRQKPSSKTFSIFGQIEEAAASSMLEQGMGRKIETCEFPDPVMCPDVWTNERGQPAKFAIILTKHEEQEFNRRVASLRA